jgi:hypothetical protein
MWGYEEVKNPAPVEAGSILLAKLKIELVRRVVILKHQKGRKGPYSIQTQPRTHWLAPGLQLNKSRERKREW